MKTLFLDGNRGFMIFSIQYMRAIAALLVVINHAAWKGAQFSTDPLGWFNIGGAGVDLFFIISGYIMCHTVYLKKKNFSSFLNARLKRIMPLYWVLTTMALTIFIIFPAFRTIIALTTAFETL